jgi:hypothetical protein
MPWNIDGTFSRTNPDFSGTSVWQQDQQATIKIIAARHDFHDQDIADGVTLCLNRNGYNSMLADINMGGFNVTNMADAVNSTDATTLNQLDAVEAKVDQNTADIAAIQTSDPNSIITDVSFGGINLTHTRALGDFVVPLRRFNEFKAGKLIRHLGVDLTAAATTALDTQVANRWYMFNNLTGTMDLNIIRPTGTDADLGENYFTEGMVIVENGTTPAAITIQADGVDVIASEIIGSPSLNASARYTLSYSIQRIAGDSYRQAFIWSAS